MAITTSPVFYYVDAITQENRFLNFNEGSGELTAEINPGGYSPSELMTATANALNTVGTQVYTVSFDRDTRLVTISASSNFDLLVTSGSNVGLSAFSTLGFTTERLGGNSYVGDVPIGDEYLPQLPLQEFRGFEDSLEGVQASINESGSGIIEVITFGNRRFMAFEIKYISDRPVSGKDSIFGNDPNAVQNARDFLTFCISKARLEFMKDKDDRSTFNVILLESTPISRQGVAYELREQYSDGLIGYYETGRLRFREIVI